LFFWFIAVREIIEIGKIYANLELHKAHEEVLCAIAEDIFENATATDSLTVACFCVGSLLPTIRYLSTPASRVILKTVSLLINKFPVIGIGCLLVPSLLDINYPFIDREIAQGCFNLFSAFLNSSSNFKIPL
jgi:hypothetical protein